jgi:aminopeptidase N
MDEGWAAYLPGDISAKYSAERDYIKYTTDNYLSLAGYENELPLMVPSFQHGNYSSLRVASYSRPATAYRFLLDALGYPLFKKCLLTYMSRWNGKHPLPYDFFYTFNEVSEQDLNWFWDPWFFQSGYPDLAIQEVKDNSVIIEKIGTHPIPIQLKFIFENGKEVDKYISTAIWKDGQSKVPVELPRNHEVVKIELGNDHIPDVNTDNNIWEIE